MKILMVAPLPTDVGGSYTSGICKVAYELSIQKYDGVKLFLSSTNIHQSKAKKLCVYRNQYNGYRWCVMVDILLDVVLHPMRSIREFKYYKEKCHVNPLRYEFYKVNIRKHIKLIRPDIIHVHTTECPAVKFANIYNVPIVDTMHGVFYRGLESQKNHGDFLKACVESCDYFTGLTVECEVLMKKYFSIPDSKLTIIPNGVNTALYFYDERQREILRHQNNVGNAIVFITVASITERKGQYRFLRVLEKLNIDFRYWILGEGVDRQKIENYCREKGLADKVKCFGSIDSSELFKYYSAADIYAHASTMEGQALCEMEAYATGIRTIVNEVIKDTVVTFKDNDESYYLLDFENINNKEMKEWIYKGNPSRKSRADLSWAKIAERYSNLYKHIASI